MRPIIDVFVGQIKSDDLVTVGVDADMQLAPRSAFRSSVFFEKPFAGAAKFQSRAIDDQMQFACSGNRAALNRQPTRSAAQRRMVWNRKVDLQQPHDRADQPALRFGVKPTETALAGLARFRWRGRNNAAGPPGSTRLRFPIRQGFLDKPNQPSDFRAIAKRCVIVPPIGDPIFLTGNMATTFAMKLERHNISP